METTFVQRVGVVFFHFVVRMSLIAKTNYLLNSFWKPAAIFKKFLDNSMDKDSETYFTIIGDLDKLGSS